MVFDNLLQTDQMFESSSSSIIQQPLSNEHELLQIESTKQNITLNNQQNSVNDIYGVDDRYHRLKSITSINHSSQHKQQTEVTVVDEKSTDSIWPSSDNHQLMISTSKSSPIIEFYPDSSMTSYSSSSSISSFDLYSSSSSTDSHHINTPETKNFSSSSGYDSSLNSIPDHFFPSSPNSIVVPNSNIIEQFINLHLENQSSYDQDITFSLPSSFNSTSSSFFPQETTSNINSSLYYRKCISNNQLSSDTDDDSQSTTISTNVLPLQQQDKRPRSLPIAIQQPKGLLNDSKTDHDSQNSPHYHCLINSSEEKHFQTNELNSITFANGIYSKNDLNVVSNNKLHINEQITINQKNSLEHFIMSPTDKIKIQMKYQENDTKNNELKISQPEDIDFKRSKLKAIRVLYQNRLNFNNMQSTIVDQNLTKFPLKTAGYCNSPLAKRTVNPRLFRNVLSCSVFETDDEHEVVSSTNQTGVNATCRKSHIETFNYLRINFIESLLHGKILPCGILDGFTVKLGASGLFIPKQVILPVTTFWFNVSEHEAASPYLGFINLQCLPKRGYHTPTKGTITLALLNPNGIAIHLFIMLYDLSDMPPDHRTFIRQRIILISENTDNKKIENKQSKENLRYLAHIRFVTSQTGKLYLHSDIRLIFARNKFDCDDRIENGKTQLITLTDIPTPKYWSRK